MSIEKKVLSRMHLSRLMLCEKMGWLSEKNRKVLADWLEENEHHQDLYEKLPRTLFPFRMVTEKEQHKAWKDFNKRYRIEAKKPKIHRSSYWIAALITGLIISTFALYYFPGNNKAEEITIPGRSNNVQLVMDGNNIMVLDPELLTEEFTTESFRILNNTKTVDYSENSAGGQDLYHTLIVPKYGEYSVILEDRSRIRINSGGKLRYPVHFSKDKREVWLEGEAYFEVTKDTQKEFIIHALDVEITVLGTSFNVEAIRSEKTVTATLIEGSIEVSNEKEQRTIYPGQQAEVNLNNSSFTVSRVDVNVATAWLRDRFYFDEKSLDEIMKTLGNWYDFEVEYATEYLKRQQFSMEISRFENIDNILELLEETQRVKFEKKGRKIIIQ